MRRVWLASLAVAGLIAAIPSGATAATQLGQTFDPPGHYPGDHTVLQSVSPGDRYRAPSDGVITSWSTFADETTPALKLKVGRPAPGADLTMAANFTVIGESQVQDPVTGLNSFLTRIPVKAGDVIGFYTGSGGNLISLNDPAYRDHFEPTDVLPGQTALFSVEDFQLDISALLEPDCDTDGLGDETQDSNVPCGKTCKGEPVTIVGTEGDNELTGTPERDVISGLGGRDEMSGLAGKDLICGGKGKDTLRGGKGKDKLYGQKGKDKLAGGGGKDRCVGGKKDDTAKKCEVEKSI